MKKCTGIFGERENAISLAPNRKVLATPSNDNNGGPSRIQNTTRVEYKNYFGAKAKDVYDIKCLDVIRELYQDAWKRAHDSEIPEAVNKYRNELIIENVIL